MKPSGELIHKHQMRDHQYADDTIMYLCSGLRSRCCKSLDWHLETVRMEGGKTNQVQHKQDKIVVDLEAGTNIGSRGDCALPKNVSSHPGGAPELRFRLEAQAEAMSKKTLPRFS